MSHREMIRAFCHNKLSFFTGKTLAAIIAEELIDLLERFFTIERIPRA